MNRIYLLAVIASVILTNCMPQNKTEMPEFIEIEVQNHMILHGFDENNKEIIEEVTLDQHMTKLIRVDRIQSVSEKYLLSTYGFGRLVYWEYKGSYADLKALLADQ